MLADMLVYLKSLSPLTSIVGQRIYPHHIPQGISTFPVLTFQQVSIAHGHTLDAGSGVATARVQIDCWGDTLLSVENLGESVRSALQSYQGGMGTTNVHYIQIESERDLHEQRDDGSDSFLYRRSQDYLIKYTEGTVSVAPGGPFTGQQFNGSLNSPLTIRPATNLPQLYLQQDNADIGWSLHADSSNGYLSFLRGGGVLYMQLSTSRLALSGALEAVGNVSGANFFVGIAGKLDWGFNSTLERVTFDGHMKYSSQNSIHEFLGGVSIGAYTTPPTNGLAVNGNITCANVISRPSASITPAINGELVVEATSNTSVKLKLKGSDGVVRSVTLTLS